MEFIVTTNNPKNDTKGKKRVRSIAALKGWPERRRRAFEHLEDRQARVARKNDEGGLSSVWKTVRRELLARTTKEDFRASGRPSGESGSQERRPNTTPEQSCFRAASNSFIAKSSTTAANRRPA
ncbi:uncharacterized protein MYCGRDRAFT_106800 [Zymoseptoria tritici IPO323]|uniref:Uncharacterized protein n=1 Tax=Zymoseptoria tritici (strain CBS 115943 / IPO323) TaxID=336722 RepID=F9WYQ2_ZYMTI|nr:uncharacterized protein MYCGRDRAFT_106800 [Zymoseptoria tritici IPO323]EGP92705.1 hypothetical protein MYCGRDRAFT_106800 [Zymoseptoria tritici IPO323]